MVHVYLHILTHSISWEIILNSSWWIYSFTELAWWLLCIQRCHYVLICVSTSIIDANFFLQVINGRHKDYKNYIYGIKLLSLEKMNDSQLTRLTILISITSGVKGSHTNEFEEQYGNTMLGRKEGKATTIEMIQPASNI